MHLPRLSAEHVAASVFLETSHNALHSHLLELDKKLDLHPVVLQHVPSRSDSIHAGSSPAPVDHHRAGVRQQCPQGVQASRPFCGGLPRAVAAAAAVGLGVVVHSHLLHRHESTVSCLEPYEGFSAPASRHLTPGPSQLQPVVLSLQMHLLMSTVAVAYSCMQVIQLHASLWSSAAWLWWYHRSCERGRTCPFLLMYASSLAAVSSIPRHAFQSGSGNPCTTPFRTMSHFTCISLCWHVLSSDAACIMNCLTRSDAACYGFCWLLRLKTGCRVQQF